MNTNAMVPATSRDLARNVVPLVKWEEALQTFLNTLGSPRTAKVYQRAVKEAMEALGVEYAPAASTTASTRGGARGRPTSPPPIWLSIVAAWWHVWT